MKKVSKISITIIMTILLNLCFTVTVKAADSYEDVIKGFKEVAYSYYMRGPDLQYNGPKGRLYVFQPEDATRQKNYFVHCNDYFYNVYYELIGTKLNYDEFWETNEKYNESVESGKIYNYKEEVRAKSIDKTKEISAKEIVAFGENNAEKTKITMYFNDGTIMDTDSETDDNKLSVEKILPYLRPGDALIYTGHVMMVYDLIKDDNNNVTDACLIHAMFGIGDGYVYSRIGQVVKDTNNVKKVRKRNTLFISNNKTVFCK